MCCHATELRLRLTHCGHCNHITIVVDSYRKGGYRQPWRNFKVYCSPRSAFESAGGGRPRLNYLREAAPRIAVSTIILLASLEGVALSSRPLLAPSPSLLAPVVSLAASAYIGIDTSGRRRKWKAQPAKFRVGDEFCCWLQARECPHSRRALLRHENAKIGPGTARRDAKVFRLGRQAG